MAAMSSAWLSRSFCGVNAQGIVKYWPLNHAEESKDTYQQLFEGLKERGLQTPSLVVSDAHKGLIAAIRTSFVGASWQRCKVHFMRNILAHIPHRDKAELAGQLKEMVCPSAEGAKERAAELAQKYAAKYPKAIETLEDGLRDSLSFYAFPKLDSRKIARRTCWKGSTRRYGGEQGLLESSRTQTHIYAWLPRFSWNMRKTGRFPEVFSEESIRTLLPQAA